MFDVRCSQLFLLAVFCATVLTLTARGQGMSGLEAMDFRAPLENYPPPFESQVKTLLEAAKVQPLSDGLILLTGGVKLETFNTNGAVEMAVRSPECVFDSDKRIVRSASALQLHTADGRFFIEGRGFLWTQTGATLVLSNDVHTVIHQALLASGTTAGGAAERDSGAAAGPPIQVFADWFRYERDRGVAVYRGNVRVSGTNLALTARTLTLDLPPTGGPLQGILAEGNVVMDHGDLHATGERARYTAPDNVIVVTGHPVWRMGPRSGRGDELTVDRARNIFRVDGHAHLKLPRASLGAGLLLQPEPAPSKGASAPDRFIEISCGSYQLSTNRAVFRDSVHATELEANKPLGRLECSQMSVSFGESNQVRGIVASGNVAVEQGSGRITAARAVFSGTNSTVEFAGHPAWRLDTRQGSGDVLVLDRARNDLKALGHARMKLPASQMQIVEMSPASAPARAAADGEHRGAVDVSCDRYDLTPERSVFSGGVSVVNPRGQLFCDQLTVDLAQRPGAESQRAVAAQERNRVEIVWLDAEGRTNYAWSSQAVYTRGVANSVTNELVTLTGHPVVVNPQGSTTADRIVWDRVRNTVFAANAKSEIRAGAAKPPAGSSGRTNADLPKTETGKLSESGGAPTTPGFP